MTYAFTPWFSGRDKPARVGVYQRYAQGGPVFSLWDGARWCFNAATPPRALQNASAESMTQIEPWRGLAEEPRA